MTFDSQIYEGIYINPSSYLVIYM